MTVRTGIAVVLISLGVLVVAISILGLFRLRNALERLHAGAVTDTLGVLLIVAGLCVLCGLLFGPVSGFLAAGIGSGLYDIVAGWGAECVITFFNKGMIAFVAGIIA